MPFTNAPESSEENFFASSTASVQDDLRRRVRAVHFMNGQPQNGAIDGRQPFEPPVIGMLDNDCVQRG